MLDFQCLPTYWLHAQAPRRDVNWSAIVAGEVGPIQYGALVSAVDASGRVYVAGHTDLDGKTVAQVAIWNGSWRLLEGWLQARFGTAFVNAIAYATNGDVYIGGVFDETVNQDGSVVATENSARWRAAGGKWYGLGNGVSDDVFAIALDANDNVYAGGNFIFSFNPDGSQVLTRRIGKWNNAASLWEALGDGADAPLTALAVDANGRVDDTTAYFPNPEGISIKESVLLQDLAITPEANEVPVVFFHGVTDAPSVDVVTAAGDTLIAQLPYAAASVPLSLAPGSYTVGLLRSSDKQKLGTHTFAIANQADQYSVVMLSGFLDPAANQNGPALELGVYEVALSLVTAVAAPHESMPHAFALAQNYPNPFNPVTSIQYSVASEQLVSLKVFDALGREVAMLVNERKSPGAYRVTVEAHNLPSGIYFVQLQAGELLATRKMVLLR